MSHDRLPRRSSQTFQRITQLVAVLAILLAWRERSFARNQLRFGAPQAPTR